MCRKGKKKKEKKKKVKEEKFTQELASGESNSYNA